MSVNVGLQLYSVRNQLANDPRETIEEVANLGFSRIEGANHDAANDPGIGIEISAKETISLLKETGVSLLGCHINPLDPEALKPALDFQAECGSSGVGCDIEFFPYGDTEYVLRRTEMYNRVGEMCSERGLTFYYHNHFQEFQEFDGTYVYQTILDNTDPSLVKLEMDTYWMYRGGQDPLYWIREYGERLLFTHQKDFPKDAARPLDLYEGVVSRTESIDMDLFEAVKVESEFVEIGTGSLPIQSIIDELDKLPDFACMFLEQDHTSHPELESIGLSRRAFEKFDKVNFK